MDLMSALWRVNLMLELNHTLLSKEEASMKVLKTAASIIPVCNLHAIVRFKDYIEIFWRLIWSKSTTKIGLGLIFAPAFSVAELILRCIFQRTKPSLGFVTNIQASSANKGVGRHHLCTYCKM
jgi:hypothetical protein